MSKRVARLSDGRFDAPGTIPDLKFVMEPPIEMKGCGTIRAMVCFIGDDLALHTAVVTQPGQ